MDGIDYLNPSGICSPYERKEITSKNIEPLDFEDKGPIQTLMKSLAKTQARIEDLYCLKVFCEDNINALNVKHLTTISKDTSENVLSIAYQGFIEDSPSLPVDGNKCSVYLQKMTGIVQQAVANNLYMDSAFAASQNGNNLVIE